MATPVKSQPAGRDSARKKNIEIHWINYLLQIISPALISNLHFTQ